MKPFLHGLLAGIGVAILLPLVSFFWSRPALSINRFPNQGIATPDQSEATVPEESFALSVALSDSESKSLPKGVKAIEATIEKLEIGLAQDDQSSWSALPIVEPTVNLAELVTTHNLIEISQTTLVPATYHTLKLGLSTLKVSLTNGKTIPIELNEKNNQLEILARFPWTDPEQTIQLVLDLDLNASLKPQSQGYAWQPTVRRVLENDQELELK